MRTKQTKLFLKTFQDPCSLHTRQFPIIYRWSVTHSRMGYNSHKGLTLHQCSIQVQSRPSAALILHIVESAGKLATIARRYGCAHVRTKASYSYCALAQKLELAEASCAIQSCETRDVMADGSLIDRAPLRAPQKF